VSSQVETWRAIPGFEGLYEASHCGQIRSLDKAGRRGRVLKQRTLDNGYRIVMMSKGGKYQNKLVHRLVLAAFTGGYGPQCRHLNGIRVDNRLENLAWGTPADNAKDQLRHGMHRNARKSHCHRGHRFTPDNTYVRPNGSRNCRACRKGAND